MTNGQIDDDLRVFSAGGGLVCVNQNFTSKQINEKALEKKQIVYVGFMY